MSWRGESQAETSSPLRVCSGGASAGSKSGKAGAAQGSPGMAGPLLLRDAQGQGALRHPGRAAGGLPAGQGVLCHCSDHLSYIIFIVIMFILHSHTASGLGMVCLV